MLSHWKYGLIVVFLGVPSMSAAYTITVEPSQDTYITSAHQNTNYGTASYMEVYTDSSYPPPNRSGLVQFNLPTLPQNAVLQSATLSLYYYDQIYFDSNDVLGVGLYAVEPLHGYLHDPGQEYQRRDWTETGATWNNFKLNTVWQLEGGESTDYDHVVTPDATLTFVDTSPFGYKTWTVTNRVSQWYNGTDINRGWLVRVSSINSSNNAGMVFYARENGSYKPQLTINYTIVPEPGALLLLTLGIAGLLAYTWRGRR